MPIAKSRIDVWRPKLKQVDGVVSTSPTYDPYETYSPPLWVSLETPANLITNQKRANALSALEIDDSLYQPRTARFNIANRSNDYRAVYNHQTAANIAATTYTHIYKTSDGADAHTGSRLLPRSWGLYTNFFYPFQFIRIVDTETNLVLFSGRIYKIDLQYEEKMGSIVRLECRDALEEIASLNPQSLLSYVDYDTEKRRSNAINYGLHLAFNYHADGVKPPGGAEGQENPIATDLPATFNVTNESSSTSDAQNTYNRFERSKTTFTTDIQWRLNRTGAKSLLSEFTKFAIAEPHENETADDQFGYDFFVDSNIGMYNLSAIQDPPAAYFNYFKRGHRLSKVGSDADIQKPEKYGLTVILPTNRTHRSAPYGHKAGTQVATKLMHQAFSFENPHDDMFTHGILTYDSAKDHRKSASETEAQLDKAQKITQKTFEIIWVRQLNGQFDYQGKNFDDIGKGVEAGAFSADPLYVVLRMIIII